jgi:hypothetical protein
MPTLCPSWLIRSRLVEICVGVICSCMPAFSCMLRHHLHSFERFKSGLLSPYHSFRHLLSRLSGPESAPSTAVSYSTRVTREGRNWRSNPDLYSSFPHGSGSWKLYGRSSEANTRARIRTKAFLLHETLSRVGSAILQSRKKNHETLVAQTESRQR